MTKKTIYDITQDELDFLYMHCQKIKEEAARLYNHNFILQGENEYLKKQLEEAARLYNQNFILQDKNEYLKKQLKEFKSGNKNKNRE